MTVLETEIPGVLIVEPRVFGDPRGFFMETFQRERYAAAGIDAEFVQDNLSFSERGVLRGLHFQNPGPQGKLVGVLSGEVFDVVVDLRRASPTFGRWVGAVLSAENHRQLWVPEGLAHGFLVTGDHALFAYKCTAPYRPETEATLLWNDPEIGVQWPTDDVRVSAKDEAGQSLQELEDCWFA